MQKEKKQEKHQGLLYVTEEFALAFATYKAQKDSFPERLLIVDSGRTCRCFGSDAEQLSKTVDQRQYSFYDEKENSIDYVQFSKKDLNTSLAALQRVKINPVIIQSIKKKQVSFNVSNNRPNTPKKISNMEKKEKETYAAKTAEQPPVQAQEQQTQAREPRAPQYVTVNGDKVSHAHVFPSKDNPQAWFFTAKLNGQPLKPQLVAQEDLADFHNRKLDVKDMMNIYYPTKMLPKVSPDAYRFPREMEGGHQLEKFNVYKDSNPESKTYGKHILYAKVGNDSLRAVATQDELSAYFDKVLEPVSFVENRFGERLQLASYYQQYRLPTDIVGENLKIQVDRNMDEKAYHISVEMADGTKTERKQLGYHDAMALYQTKTATKEQLAAKYFNPELMAIAKSAKQEQPQGLKR